MPPLTSDSPLYERTAYYRAKAQDALFDCDRNHCLPKASASPAIAAWWTRRQPKPGQLDDLCRGADIVIMRANLPAPLTCSGAIVLGPDDFVKGGAAEVYAAPNGWRLQWAQPLRGVRPWTTNQ